MCGNGPGQCCVAENLDNLFGNDFQEGELSSFTGHTLGECNGFDLGQKSDWTAEGFMTIYHSGETDVRQCSFFMTSYADF